MSNVYTDIKAARDALAAASKSRWGSEQDLPTIPQDQTITKEFVDSLVSWALNMSKRISYTGAAGPNGSLPTYVERGSKISQKAKDNILAQLKQEAQDINDRIGCVSCAATCYNSCTGGCGGSCKTCSGCSDRCSNCWGGLWCAGCYGCSGCRGCGGCSGCGGTCDRGCKGNCSNLCGNSCSSGCANSARLGAINEGKR